MSSDRTRATSGATGSAADTAVQPTLAGPGSSPTMTSTAQAASSTQATPPGKGADGAGPGDQGDGSGRSRRFGFRRSQRADRQGAAVPAGSARSTAAASAAAAGPAAQARPPAGPRKVRLAVSRIDPWSVMKLSFLLSIAIGIALVIATAVIWNVLNTMQVFTQADGIVTDIAGTESFIDILDYVQFSRVMSIAVVIAVVDVVILTALSTLFAFIYNVTAALVGGLHVTLTDD